MSDAEPRIIEFPGGWKADECRRHFTTRERLPEGGLFPQSGTPIPSDSHARWIACSRIAGTMSVASTRSRMPATL